MAVYTEESVKANVRVREGKRVFYLADGDHLTPSAREWLRQEKVEVLPSVLAKPERYRTLEGISVLEKPEHWTHLKADLLVPKNHPRIVFRGSIDELEAEILLAGCLAAEMKLTKLASQLKEVLDIVRNILRCEVMEEPFSVKSICGMSMETLREHSHYPQKYYDQPHFMPEANDGMMLLTLNRLRTCVRKTEIAAYRAFIHSDATPERSDLICILNRLSSFIWILMIRMKKEAADGK